MIHLVTGLPGHGKTHYVVELLVKRLKDKKDILRPCFANINELDHDKLKTFPLDDPEKWFDLPDSSIIVIDECQRYFRPRANGSVVPEHVSKLETHRHDDIDFILITQGPKLIDANVRALVDTHTHCFSPFGSKMRKLFEYEGVNDNPLPATVKQVKGEVSPISPSVFGYYKSASSHSKKLRLPWKIIAGTAVAGLSAIFFIAKTVIGFMPEEPSLDIAEPAQVEPLPAEQLDVEQVPSLSMPHELGLGEPSELLPWRYAGGMLGPTPVFWINDPRGETLRLDDFSGYRINGNTVDLLDMDSRPIARITDRRFVRDLSVTF